MRRLSVAGIFWTSYIALYALSIGAVIYLMT